MNEVKPWYQSRTIWASLVTLLATVLAIFGIEIDADTQSQLVIVALQSITVIGSLLAIVGRLSATSVIE